MWLDDDRRDVRGHVMIVHGDLVGRDSEALFTAFTDAFYDGASAVIVDLTDNSFLDSTGLATLIACWRALPVHRTNGFNGSSRGGRRLGLVVPEGGYVRRILQVRGLDHLFAVTPSRDQTFSSIGLAAAQAG